MMKISGRKLPNKKKKLPKNLQPIHIQRAYYHSLKNVIVDPLKKIVREILIPEIENIINAYNVEVKSDSEAVIKKDQYSWLITDVFKKMRIEATIGVTDFGLVDITEQVANQTNAFQATQFRKIFNTVLGVNPLINEQWLEPKVASFTENNVSLIKTIPQDYFKSLEGMVRRNVEQGMTTATLRHQIENDLMIGQNVPENRAKLIARDQVQKFYSNLNELRQTSAGVEKYKWRTTMAITVRGRPDGLYPHAIPSHWDREDKTYSWEKPPEGGHPGQAINCNCYAEPILDDFF